MKEKTNTVLSSTLAAVGIAAVLFCLTGAVFDLIGKGSFRTENYSYTKMVVGTLVIGLGFGLPAFVYEKDSLSMPVQILTHMGIGCVVMTITAFAVGWIPTEKGPAAAAVSVAGEIAVAFLVWVIFYTRQKKLAREMNRKISEKNQ